MNAVKILWQRSFVNNITNGMLSGRNRRKPAATRGQGEKEGRVGFWQCATRRCGKSTVLKSRKGEPRRFNIAAGLIRIRRECMQNMIIKHYLSFVFSGAGINFLRRTRRYLLKNAIMFSARFCNGHPRGAWQKPLFRFAPLAV